MVFTQKQCTIHHSHYKTKSATYGMVLLFFVWCLHKNNVQVIIRIIKLNQLHMVWCYYFLYGVYTKTMYFTSHHSHYKTKSATYGIVLLFFVWRLRKNNG